MAVTDSTSPEMRRALAPGGTLDALPDDFDVLGARYSGKVRENFTRGGERLILVTDRVSAFDVVLGTIPFKGQVLNGLARFWFDATAAIFPNHMLGVPDPQAMRAVECTPIPVEFVVRGYLAGSGWKEYRQGGSICGVRVPPGLRNGDQLPEPILTPTTKAAAPTPTATFGLLLSFSRTPMRSSPR